MSPQRRQVVLVGAGHAHLHVAAHAAELARDGISLVLVDPGTFWYSGLGTGMLAGQYDAREDQVDPEQLVRREGGHFVRDRMTGLDARERTVALASGDTLEYDALSLNVGSKVDTACIPGADDHAWTVKPISNLWRLRQALGDRFRSPSSEPLRVLVVGGGPTGCEVAACMDSLASRHGAATEVSLVTRGDRLLSGYSPAASQALTSFLRHRGIHIVCPWPVRQIEEGTVVGEDGQRIHADIIVVATGLVAPPLLECLGLPLDEREGLRVRDTLQSTGDDDVFAAGDCASLEGHRLPKLGVFGVRQAPILLHNIAALLQGRPLKAYRPQKRYLMILNLGCGSGLAIYGRLHWLGRLSYRVKDHIDRRFLDRYR